MSSRRALLVLLCLLASLDGRRSHAAAAPEPTVAPTFAPEPAVAPLSVARTSLDRLVWRSDLIAVVTVTDLEGLFGQAFARAMVEEVWKGEPVDELRFRAHGTWTCDISGAVPGERAVVFLDTPDDEGRWSLAHSGRGRFPLRAIDGLIQATVWSSTVRAPEERPWRQVPTPYTGYKGCLPLDELGRLVVGLVDEHQAERAGLTAELLDMLAADQRYRDVEAIMAMPRDEQQAFMAEGAAADVRHTEWLEQLWRRRGWPTREMVGAEACHAAFLLVQHADHAPAFQARMLPLLEAAAERGEVAWRDVAYLTDRVAVKAGRPQVYGTQYAVKTDERGAAVADAQGRLTYLLPVVEDLEQLDARRREVGLEPWRAYERSMAASQGREPAEQPLTADG